MATQSPPALDTTALRAHVRDVYGRLANRPDGEFHFHRGPDYAANHLRYDRRELAELPDEATASFAGVGNPLAIDAVRPGETVLDVGCGTGTDLLLAARRVGPRGSAIGVDMTEPMLAQARRAARRLGLDHVDLRRGDVQDLPVDSNSVDVVISNGVLNLAPDKHLAFSEIARVLRPGGRLLLADIVIGEELPDETRADIDLWAG